MRATDDANCGMLFSNPLSDLVDVRREAGEAPPSLCWSEDRSGLADAAIVTSVSMKNKQFPFVYLPIQCRRETPLLGVSFAPLFTLSFAPEMASESTYISCGW